MSNNNEVKEYYINENEEFVIQDYNRKKVFSSFLPSISGIFGKPLWAYYVNRGQCIATFGINNKDNSILEFQPANKAYMQTSICGFRTFLKIKDKSNSQVKYYEPFQNVDISKKTRIVQSMKITSHDLKIQEINYELGIQIDITYLTLPNEKFSSLIRSLEIKNLNKYEVEIEIVDGLPGIIPYYLTNDDMKNVSNLRQAWIEVEHYNEIPFYRIKALPDDVAETVLVEGGNFYLNFTFEENEISLSKHIIEKDILFREITDLTNPIGFYDSSFEIPHQQVNVGVTPCGFGYRKIILKENDIKNIYTLIGYSENYNKLKKFVLNKLSKKYLEEKFIENKAIIENLKNPIFTSSNSKKFDLYCRQTFLDNILRGGFPVKLGMDKYIYYIYSRKHGDLEREYNFFQVDSTPYSQGNANYRDVNQNRRNDIGFFNDINDTNIKEFFNLIQLDGFNPLVLKGAEFRVNNEDEIKRLVKEFIKVDKSKKVINYLKKPYTPGGFLVFLENLDIQLSNEELNEFVNLLISLSSKENKADFKEGYWVDHWTYNIDLIEQYIRIYPDKVIHLFFNDKEYTYYDTDQVVMPRRSKYVLVNDEVRQYNGIIKNKKKEEIIKLRTKNVNKVHTNNGIGNVYKCNLISKIITLYINKMASLDPEGIGIEMEANKPGWCDALNGLPSLLGSSLNVSAELKRLSLLLINIINNNELKNEIIYVPEEVYEFYTGIDILLKKNEEAFIYWDESNKLKEEFREKTIMGISGVEKGIQCSLLYEFLVRSDDKLEKGMRKGLNKKDNMYYTYFINEVSEYEIYRNQDENFNYPTVKVKGFRQRPIPYFLESQVHMLRIEDDYVKCKTLYEAVKKSGLYDKKLKMYKVNDNIMNETNEIGRQNIFPRGWLENEAIFLHMEYKYLLELLRCKLYEEFIEDFEKALVPFLDPSSYGRSILENSSFIVSEVHPNRKLHGQGFVSRLTGASAEFISIWIFMTQGQKTFYINDLGELELKFNPVIPEWLFTKKEKIVTLNHDDKIRNISLPENTFAYMFLSKTLVIYHNPYRKNTYGKDCCKVRRIVLTKNESEIVLKQDFITSDYAKQIRNGEIEQIDIYFEKKIIPIH